MGFASKKADKSGIRTHARITLMRNLNIRQTLGFYTLSLESHALDRSAILPCKFFG